MVQSDVTTSAAVSFQMDTPSEGQQQLLAATAALPLPLLSVAAPPQGATLLTAACGDVPSVQCLWLLSSQLLRKAGPSTEQAMIRWLHCTP